MGKFILLFYQIAGCNKNRIFTIVPLIYNRYFVQVIDFLQHFIRVHMTTVIALNIIGKTEIPIRLAYTGYILFLLIIQSKFNAISELEPNFSYES